MTKHLALYCLARQINLFEIERKSNILERASFADLYTSTYFYRAIPLHDLYLNN